MSPELNDGLPGGTDADIASGDVRERLIGLHSRGPTATSSGSRTPRDSIVDGSDIDTYPAVNTPTITVEEQQKNPGGISCPTRKNIIQRRTSWLSIAILILAFYSSAVSGLYLVVACVKPRYGEKIGGNGGLAPSTASLLSALFAKTVELSFVTVFVAFLGQVLSRKALARNTDGITIADMSMRTWVMQPGTLITHWENVKHSALSVIGAIALTTTFVAMFYTTAAEALVSPKLAFGSPELRNLTGEVKTKFANNTYLFMNCQTPISSERDEDSGSTCMQISYSGQSYNNYQQYISDWTNLTKSSSKGSADMQHRLLPTGLWYSNTTVKGNWIEIHNMTELSAKWGRMVLNVTAAMPHANVFTSSRHPKNAIRQPEELEGQGEFEIHASVPSPAVNVICAGMTKKELEPIIYTQWPHPKRKFNSSTWMKEQPSDIPLYPSWLNKTVVDDIFEFGEKFGESGQRPPIFPKIPMPFNTILNGTGRFTANSLYILATSPPDVKNPPHFLCQLKGGQTNRCSTHYRATASGGQLNAHCNDPDDELAYSRHDKIMESLEIDLDWKNIAEEWSKSIALNTGLDDGAGSNARLLTQLVPPFDPKTNTTSLDPKRPSVAEALAVMANPLLLLSTQDAPFYHGTNFAEDRLKAKGAPVFQEFRSSVRTTDYASGGNQSWHAVFYIVLALVFLTSLICLGYMYLGFRMQQLTDFTEPQNALALALNSPPSQHVSGSCGGGPEGKELTHRWIISMDEQYEHYYIVSKDDATGEKISRNIYNNTGYTGYEHLHEVDESGIENGPPPRAMVSPRVSDYRRFSHAKSSLSLL